ncbi:MAG TPA: hypothetical protein VKV32_15910 [Stellaceae bacterium]|nr:hypothetical protein [Stellaceae bacterium]
MATAARGVLYMVWGEAIETLLQRSIASVKRHHPELPIEVVRLDGGGDDPKLLLEKARMAERTPFAETLFLDADTVVLDRLDFGFDSAKRYGLACCICESPWARRYRGLAGAGEIVEYNTGVLFFTAGAKPVFDRWPSLAAEIDSASLFAKDGKPFVMPANDQASFAAAVERAGFSPFVLPPNWNFRYEFQKSFFGTIKIWHSYYDLPEIMTQLADYYRNPDSVIQYVEMS